MGGGALDRETLALAKARAPVVVAADGGANWLSAWGEPAAAVIGDMDSVEDADGWRARGAHVARIAEQETTDLEKCLYATEAPFYLGVGLMGRRFDHTLGALHALMRRPEKRIVLIGEEDVVFLAPPVWRARLEAGARVSFFPLRPVTGLTSEGLVWPIDAIDFAPGVRIGTSNAAAAETVAARFDDFGMAATVERRFLDAVLDSLTTADR